MDTTTSGLVGYAGIGRKPQASFPIRRIDGR
jgi:hypothetical protein